MDEARVGQKGRNGHRWWLRGERPRGLCDQRYDWAYVYAANRPDTGEDVCPVMPEVSTSAMSTFLSAFAQALPAGQHAALVLDRAGWHPAKALVVPPTITLVALPTYSPELNPEVAREIWAGRLSGISA